MAQFTYTGDDERDYADVDGSALRAVPGQSYELSTCPDDGRWSPVGAKSTPKADSAPVSTSNDETPKETA